MLNNINKLYFPKIIYYKTISVNNDSKIATLYKLDWSEKETRSINRRKKLNLSCFNVDIPNEYNAFIKDLVFAISDSYLKEIRRCSWQAVAEYNVNKGIETPLRDQVNSPADEFVYLAFSLLTDSIYDETTNYFFRGNKKYVNSLLLLKFWANQVNTDKLLSKIKHQSSLIDEESNDAYFTSICEFYNIK